MKSSKLPLSLGLFLVLCGFVSHAAQPEDTNQVKSAESAEADYARTIEKRVADILAPLKLTNSTNSARAHDLLVAQYRTLRDWHDANDSKRKHAAAEDAARLSAALKAIHEKFLADLAAALTPEQIEMVKDKMTYNKVQFTYTGYCQTWPGLTEVQKQHVLALLKEAREEAMDGGSAGEKTAVFTKYKGKINNYLSKEGYVLKKPAAPAKAAQ